MGFEPIGERANARYPVPDLPASSSGQRSRFHTSFFLCNLRSRGRHPHAYTHSFLIRFLGFDGKGAVDCKRSPHVPVSTDSASRLAGSLGLLTSDPSHDVHRSYE